MENIPIRCPYFHDCWIDFLEVATLTHRCPLTLRASLLRLLPPVSGPQGSPHSLSSHLFQLDWGYAKAFPGQLRDLIYPACPGSPLGSPSSGSCPELLPRVDSTQHPIRMPQPPQLTPLNVEVQWLRSELLPNDLAPHTISEGCWGDGVTQTE